MLPAFERYFGLRVSSELSFPVLTRGRQNFIREYFQPPEYWRSDASYLLISTLHSMVMAPLSEANAEEMEREIGDSEGYDIPEQLDGMPIGQGMIIEALSADIESIIQLSDAIARSRGRDYVSSTSVVMALGLLAPELRMSSFQIWGPRLTEVDVQPL